MKIKISKVFAVIFSLILLTACEEPNRDGQAQTPSSSSSLEGKDFNEVVELFEEEGFTNIKTEPIDDLIFGWLTKDGEVEEVAVGGDVEYTSSEWIPNDTEIIIRYHTFPEEEVADANSEEEPDESSVESEEIEEISESTSDDNNVSEKEERPVEDEIITVENNEEFAYILTLSGSHDDSIKEFAEKYAGRTIQFDGNTAYVTNHRNYNTRFDYLIYADDYSEITTIGPSFKFEDVNYYDLHLTGENVPEVFDMGLNIRITAKVGKYNQQNGIFLLEPVSIEMR